MPAFWLALILERLLDYSVYCLLLVEDDSTNAQITSCILEGFGFEVEVAEDGQKCLQKIQQKHYDLIFMDCTMPIMDGFETTKEIRRLEIEGVIERSPIVALTGNTREGDREKCLESGMDDYIPKPASEEALLKAVEDNLETE